MGFSQLERDLVFQIADREAFWQEAEKVVDGILILRYAKDGSILRSQAELAKEIKKTREQVRMRLAKAIRIMRHPHRADKYRGRALTLQERFKR